MITTIKEYKKIYENSNLDEDEKSLILDKEARQKIENNFGKKLSFTGSADWGGIDVWSVKGSKFEGYFISDDKEMTNEESYILLKRTFNETTEESDDEILFTTIINPNRFGNTQSDGPIDELIQKALEIKNDKNLVLNITNETKEVDDKLADDIVIVDKDTLKPMVGDYELVKIIDVINNPEEIKKLEEALGTSVNTDLNITEVKVGKIVWMTAMIKARNKSTANPLGELAVIQLKIINWTYGLSKLNQLKQQGKLFQ